MKCDSKLIFFFMIDTTFPEINFKYIDKNSLSKISIIGTTDIHTLTPSVVFFNNK
jgi:hypothetical protein